MIFYLIFLGFVILGLFWFKKMKDAFEWVSKNKKVGKFDKTKNVFVIIPVLDETKRIERTVGYFLSTFKHLKSMKVVLVTTESEYLLKNRTKENTIDIAKRLSEKNKKIVHYHYPIAGKKMAHQINYAINSIIRKVKPDLFVVYNADSRPHKKTFDWVLSHDDFKVFQQYGYYFKNVNEFKGILKPVLWSAAGWQTRWSIGFEINHATKQFKFLNKKDIFFRKLRYPLNYCIGHGLFFTPEVFKKLKGFDEDMHNEDAIFGLELSYLNEPIVPIPYFEVSDSPNRIKSLFIQKSTWFFGPLQAFAYMKKIMRKRKNIDFLALLALTSKLFSHAVYWIAGPTLMTFSILLALINLDLIKLLLSFIMIILFLALPNYLAWLFCVDKKNKNRKLVFAYQLFGSFFCYFLHGLSAYRTLANVTISKLISKDIKKIKTPN